VTLASKTPPSVDDPRPPRQSNPPIADCRFESTGSGLRCGAARESDGARHSLADAQCRTSSTPPLIDSHRLTIESLPPSLVPSVAFALIEGFGRRSGASPLAELTRELA
jgi:hypothetical protein